MGEVKIEKGKGSAGWRTKQTPTASSNKRKEVNVSCRGLCTKIGGECCRVRVGTHPTRVKGAVTMTVPTDE